MKKTTKVAFSAFAIAAGAAFFSQYTSTVNGNAAGAPAGYCSDPAGGNMTCRNGSCHSGPAVTNQPAGITSNIPTAGYVPGTTYTFTATAVGVSSTKFGFEVSPQNSSGTLLGSMAITDATNTQLVGSGKYITHKSAGTKHSWSFNWTAPANGSGTVTFYGAFNISNNDGNNTGDTIRTATLVIPQDPTTGISDITDVSESVTVFPNPVNNVMSINSNDADTIQLTIINTNGIVVKDVTVNNNQAVNVEDLTKGVYILRIKTKTGIAIKKIIKN